MALRNTMQAGGKAVNESLAKDVSKALRGLLNDKFASIQRDATEVGGD